MRSFELRRIEEGGLGRSVMSRRNWEERNKRRCSGGPKERDSGQSALGPPGEDTKKFLGNAGADWWYQLLVNLRRLKESLYNG